MDRKHDKPIPLTLSLPASQLRELEEMKEAQGKNSIQEIVEEAIGQFLLTHKPANLPLTPRQREVLALVAEGKKSKEIAGQLKISVKTVEMHRTQLMETLDVHSIAGLVRYAIRMGLIDP
jgi:DNA-binding NarL/FixJ family response regulator